MSSAPAVERCAAHPARLAADECPRCGRRRCAVDVTHYGASGCPSCATRQSRAVRTPPALEIAVRAGLAGVAAALAGGWIATQYVGVHVMSLVVPGLVGLAAAWATSAAGRGESPSTRWIVWVAAAASALLGTALGFRLTIGGQSPLHPVGDVVPPYLCALAGVVAWPLLFGVTPRRTRDQDEGRGTT